MTLTPAVSLNFAAATDIGCKRGNNEDSFGYDAELNVYVVCDGMGGNAAGEVASGMAVRALIETFESQMQESPDDSPPFPIEERLLNSIHEANRAVRDAADGNSELQSMGTTLVCACLDGARVVIGNVGDSRAYLVRNGTCLQVTLDHSLLDEQVRSGMLTPEEAAASPLQSVITRAVGIADAVEPDLFAVDLNVEDMLLLTTDGLTRYARPEDIARIASPEADLASICHDLIEHAKQGGGVDNITCMLLRAVEVAPAPAPEEVEFSPPAIEL
ncbi:MAG: Stp1/IreP family PP2C-type Ser/Thr phosphatase [Terracidiphilus sp.]|nr:Stp1/IreP family PP2C-type Ser/Thr phosphatase [Terracidiphilus sp.]